jgi:Anti-sigma-K factor rskA
VTTSGLPPRNGYYEVWLYDPTANNMVAIGALGDGGRGTFTLPAGINLQNYHVVDVSAQDYVGGSVIAHAQSVLRGQFTQ